MNDPDGFARRLDLALRARRIGKMYALAVALDIDESALSRWRRGRSISIDNLVRLSRHLRVSIDWLLTGAGSMDVAEGDTAGARQSEILADLAALDPATCEHLASLTRHLALAHRATRLDMTPLRRSAQGPHGHPEAAGNLVVRQTRLNRDRDRDPPQSQEYSPG